MLTGWVRARIQSAQGHRLFDGLHRRRGALLSMLGFVGYTASQWGVLAVMARIGGTTTVGLYALALSVTAPFFMLTNMNLMSVLASEDRNGIPFGSFLRLRVVSLTLAIGLCLVTAWLLRYPWPVVTVIVAMALFKGCESLADIGIGLFAGRDRFDALARSMLLRGITAFLIASILTTLDMPLTWVLATTTLAHFGLWTLFDRPLLWNLSGEGSPRPIEPAHLAQLLRTGLPLGGVALMLSLQASIPRIVLERTADTAALGIFSAIAYIGVGGRLVASAFGVSVLPRLGQLVQSGARADFMRAVGRMQVTALILGLGGTGIALVAGKPLLVLLYGSVYAPYQDLLVLTMLTAGVWYNANYLQDALTSLRVLTPKLGILMVSLLVTGITAVLLTPTKGIFGAAWSALAGGIAELVGSATVLLWAVGRRFRSDSPPLHF